MDFNKNDDYKQKYKLLKKIGRGNFTEVYKAENINTKELFAIKIIKLEDIKLELENTATGDEVTNNFSYFINCIKNEIQNMKICCANNENSVKYYESYETDSELVIILE